MPDAGAEIYKVLRSKGYTPAQAAGVVGNARQESGLNPRAAGGGLFQGIGGRSRLGVGNARQQVETALREEPAAWKALRRTHTPQEAARVFSQQFERPGIPMVGNRERYASQAARQYAGLPPAAQQAMGPSPARTTGEPQPNTTFDQTGFQKASTDYSIGSLFSAKERKGNPLFETGILPTREPSRSDFQTEAPQPQPAQIVKQGKVSVFVPPSGGGAPASGGYPLGKTGKLIGTPYSGTHTLGNWESDNAIDLGVPKGTPVYATEDGTIGSQIGSLGAASGSRFAGLRLHLASAKNEWYYAHLEKLSVHAGEHVRAGQLLGYSGEANGVQHLHIASKHGSPLGLTKKGH